MTSLITVVLKARETVKYTTYSLVILNDLFCWVIIFALSKERKETLPL